MADNTNVVSNVSAGGPKLSGAIFRAPLGSTLPTDAKTDLDKAFVGVGFISDDGVENSNSPDTDSVQDWGGGTVLVTETGKEDTFKFTMIESKNVDVLKAVYGSDNVTGNVDTGITIRANSAEQESAAWVIDIIMRENVLKRIVIPNGRISDIGDISYTRSDPVGYEVTVTASPYEGYDGDTHREFLVKAAASTTASGTTSSQQDLNTAVSVANDVLQSLSSEIASAKSNLEELRSENFNSQEILSGVADVRAYLGLYDSDVIGVQVDYKNKTYKRLGAASGLNVGSDFDQFPMFGGRKRCNVANDGTINAWYGDSAYKEDGSNGQVMVYQPAFWYLVAPVEYERQSTGIGYHLRKANYYVSGKQRAGFRLHPAFYDANGNEVDHIFYSAFRGSIFDTSADAYLMEDEQVMDAGTDLFCSISGVKPASGYNQNLTITSIEQMAQNRGAGWHGDTIKATSANQLLMLIEYAGNLQTAIERGVVDIPWTGLASDDTSSYAVNTGGTSGLGNATGHADSSTQQINGQTLTNTTNGKRSISYRGMEDPWGNMWDFVYGVNIYGNGKMNGGQPYICKNFNFAESKNSDNYEAAGFCVTDKAGYVSAMGYSTTCDWLFMASECKGDSSLPIGDYTYITENLDGYRIALLGGSWYYGLDAGGFYWTLNSGVGYRYRNVGGRLVFVPTATAA